MYFIKHYKKSVCFAAVESLPARHTLSAVTHLSIPPNIQSVSFYSILAGSPAQRVISPPCDPQHELILITVTSP